MWACTLIVSVGVHMHMCVNLCMSKIGLRHLGNLSLNIHVRLHDHLNDNEAENLPDTCVTVTRQSHH